jgi:two-component system, OmpR family, sensor kinase
MVHVIATGAIVLLTFALAISVAGLVVTRNQAVRDEREVVRLVRIAERRADQVSALSHEVRTPLAMIKGAAGLLESGSAGPLTSRQAEFCETIAQQCDHLIDVAEGLLIQARIDAGLFELRAASTDIRHLVRSTTRAMRPLCAGRDQRISLNSPSSVRRVDVDSRLVRQALTNVLHNASRHTSQGGSIEVRILDNDDELVIEVIDDGAGMTSDERKQLFERFASGRPLGDGTGLGMLITKQIVELHGGRILVDTNLHRGTTIMMNFPHGSLSSASIQQTS